MSDEDSGQNDQEYGFGHELSYRIHTGRERALMIQGRKPLAVFSDLVIEGEDEADEDFASLVQSGAVVERDASEAWEPFVMRGKRVIGRRMRLYALRDEAWRIPAYLLLQRIGRKGRWDDALERLTGSLLGYTDEQNEEWLARHHRTRAGWGCFPLYAMTTDGTVDDIAELGGRALPRGFLAQARLFCSGEPPTRAALDQSGLGFTAEQRNLVRFGVTKEFFFDCTERTPSGDFISVSPQPDVSTSDLNKALATEIQTFSL
ncbi:hypothetical protein [Microvirga brassicacearum]|uniref:Uncharacterized protein n=1 Tax=Microvirga brassicacearum TaxID=2580413 RepID=A0A5N3P949_9HYPH|nr:hypothetical protein [Microvirga brassicacearum]KAB0266248.1 hypothetical protein FEZ63_14815 [Microvirga brassicacearum]